MKYKEGFCMAHTFFCGPHFCLENFLCSLVASVALETGAEFPTCGYIKK